MNELNEFTGMSDARLLKKHADLLARLRRMQASDEEMGGGSPYESIYEQIDDVERELSARHIAVDASQQ